MQPDPRSGQGAFGTDRHGEEGIDPPIDDIAAGMVGIYDDRVDPTGQSLGAAIIQSAVAIASANTPNSGNTAGVDFNGGLFL